MKKDARTELKKELHRLWRSMDFVSGHPSLSDESSPESERFADLYQQLGALWEFLGLRCQHWEGFRRDRSGTALCRICGKVKERDEYWLLLPRKGHKRIGCKAMPTSKETFPHKKGAVVLNDSIDFHGAKLAVEVQNAHRSRLLDRDITIAADRIVRLVEDGMECTSDTHTLRVRLRARRPKAGPAYGAFPSELPRKLLKRFPILLEYDKQNRFVGVTIFRPIPAIRLRDGARIKATRPQSIEKASAAKARKASSDVSRKGRP